MEPRAPTPSVAGPGGYDAGQMLATIQRIVGFGVRRPGYAQSLAVERWLEAAWQEAGLTEVRREPVPVNCWEPTRTALATADDALEVPCFPIPYTAWTPTAGLEAQAVFLKTGQTRGWPVTSESARAYGLTAYRSAPDRNCEPPTAIPAHVARLARSKKLKH